MIKIDEKTQEPILLTTDEIVEKLKAMRVDTRENPPIRFMFITTPNPNYDPEGFSQEIEDSETPDDWDGSLMELMAKRGVMWAFNAAGRNSKKWWTNHEKKLKYIIEGFHSACIMHDDGTRDYNSEANLTRIGEFSDKNGGIYDVF